MRWLVPLAAAALVAGGAVVRSASAEVTPQLPDRTPAQVLALVAGSSVRALSGTVATSTDLGLADLSSLSGLDGRSGGSGSTTPSITSLLTRFLSPTTMRVWLDGPSRMRVQLIDQMAETDLVRDGSTGWVYSSSSNTATRLTLPIGPSGQSGGPGGAAGDGTLGLPATPTPQAVAEQMLAAVGQSTKVSLGTPVRVAGRDAYLLDLAPKQNGTLVGSVHIAVDARTGLPLQVQVFARGQQAAALSIGYTAISYATPSASMFRFSPPPGATVQQGPPPGAAGNGGHASNGPAGPGGIAGGSGIPVLHGSGWTAVLELPAGALGATGATGATGPGGTAAGLGPLLDQLSQPVAGGRVVTSSLFSVLLLDDGRVLVGAVPPATLQALSSTASGS